MDFDTFLNAGWNDHATDPEDVWRRCHRFYPWIAESLALDARGHRMGALQARDRAAHGLGTMDAGDLPYAKPDFEALEASLAGSTRP